MRLMKRRQEARERGVTDKSQNKTSAYRYLISSDEYPIFAKLVKKSSLSKHIHSGDVTLLAPIDRAFEAYPDYKTLLKPGNESELDEFVSYHMLDLAQLKQTRELLLGWTISFTSLLFLK